MVTNHGHQSASNGTKVLNFFSFIPHTFRKNQSDFWPSLHLFSLPDVLSKCSLKLTIICLVSLSSTQKQYVSNNIPTSKINFLFKMKANYNAEIT